MKVIFFILLLVALGVGYLLFFSKTPSHSQSNADSPTVTNTQQPKPQPTSSSSNSSGSSSGGIIDYGTGYTPLKVKQHSRKKVDGLADTRNKQLEDQVNTAD